MRIAFIGTGGIGVPTLRALQDSSHQLVAVITQPDKPVGRTQRLEGSPVKKLAEEFKIPILQPARIKDDGAVEAIRGLNADVIFVFAYGQILSREILAAPSVACLNLHASLLPRWRGAAPIQAAITAGDAETGITVIYMNEGLDTGDVLLQDKIKISPDETGGTLHDRLAQIAPAAALRALQLISARTAPRSSQNDKVATYAPKLTRDAGQIDWTEPAHILERKIRAFDPWPGAFTLLPEGSGSKVRLKIFRARIVENSGRPGAILQADDRGLIIAAGTGALSLDQVQPEGKRRMSAGDFVRGRKLACGESTNPR